MPDHDRTAESSPRTYEPLTGEYLDRLAGLADQDHAAFTRPGGRPEYRSRRLLVVLAQGAAQHFADCNAGADRYHRAGIKDLDVWTFYAAIPGTRFPAHRRETHADFGPSALGRQDYDLAAARNGRERAMWRKWSEYQGRRVDFLVRALPVQAGAPVGLIVQAVHDWLRRGAAASGTKKPSAWHLARKAMVILTPEPERGHIIWPPGGGS